MRTIEKEQVLTTGRVDYNGNCIPPDVIEWEDYDKNPVLLYNKETEGHHGVVIGKVLNRKRVGDGFVGNLSFMERFPVADIAFEKYTQGVLPFVSIGGYAVGEEKEGVFHVMKYRVREFSLVKFPANIDCKTVEASQLDKEERDIVTGMSVEGKEMRYLMMSADNITVEALLNASENKKNMEEKEVIAEETIEKKEADDSLSEASETKVEEKEDETNVEASEKETAETKVEKEASETETETIPETAEKEVVAEEVEITAEGTKQETKASEIPQGMQWHEQNSNHNLKKELMTKNLTELNCDAEFQNRMHAVSAAVRSGAAKMDANPENLETLQVLASAMLADEKAVILASRTNYTDAVTRERKNALEVLIDCAAGNATAATLAAADLGVIKYLSLFFQRMFANDTFRRALRFVPMSDKAGAIYIEDGINAPTYVGNNTPINAPVYTYDDVKRTIARRVFAFSPILFQHSELAILSYDKQGYGVKTMMEKMMQDYSTYVLQVIANTAGISKVTTTGERTFSSQGLFPIEAPNSNLTIKAPNLDDIITMESDFLMQNYKFENGNKIEMVLPARMYGQLASDPESRNRLIKEFNGNIASHINFSATRITPRNPVARYNTASSAAELDPSMYADNNTNDDGTFTPITPATTTADHVGAGVAFVENEVIAGVGSIELIVERHPLYYGTLISGWFSCGATVARQNGVGAGLIIPGLDA